MTDAIDNFKQILEAAILTSGEPISVEQLQQMFEEPYQPSIKQVRDALKDLQQDYAQRGVELQEVASGFRFQARIDYAPWLQRMYEKKPPRYSRAFLETLALIAYKQPITRGEIEDVRGVAVSSDIVKKLMEREWIKVVGTKDVPGKPSLYATTKQFLDYFNLKSLKQLPELQEPADLNEIEARLGAQLKLEMPPLPVPEASTNDDNLDAIMTEVESAAVAAEEISQRVHEERAEETTPETASEAAETELVEEVIA